MIITVDSREMTEPFTIPVDWGNMTELPTSLRKYAITESQEQQIARLTDERDFWRLEAIQRGYRDGREDR